MSKEYLTGHDDGYRYAIEEALAVYACYGAEKLVQWLKEQEEKGHRMNTEQQSRLFAKGFEAGHKSGYKKALNEMIAHIEECMADTPESAGTYGALMEMWAFIENLKEGKA